MKHTRPQTQPQILCIFLVEQSFLVQETVTVHCNNWLFHSRLLVSLYVYFFWPTSGKLPRLKFCFPPYFGISRRCFFCCFFYNKKKQTFILFFFLLHISSSYAKIWVETKFQPREFSRSGSKEIDVERDKKKRVKKSVITMVSTCHLNQKTLLYLWLDLGSGDECASYCIHFHWFSSPNVSSIQFQPWAAGTPYSFIALSIVIVS